MAGTEGDYYSGVLALHIGNLVLPLVSKALYSDFEIKSGATRSSCPKGVSGLAGCYIESLRGF